MKTYRCPWCVSRTNHNILYFVHISRTSPLNTAICLWKLRIGLARRGFAAPDLHQIWSISRAGLGPRSRNSTPASTLAPHELRHKTQNRCIPRQVCSSCGHLDRPVQLLPLKDQSATWPEASADGELSRSESRPVGKGRRPHASQTQNVEDRAEWHRISDLGKGSLPAVQSNREDLENIVLPGPFPMSSWCNG